MKSDISSPPIGFLFHVKERTFNEFNRLKLNTLFQIILVTARLNS
jgi:hypothetical protein